VGLATGTATGFHWPARRGSLGVAALRPARVSAADRGSVAVAVSAVVVVAAAAEPSDGYRAARRPVSAGT